jgi:hypothetical protein
MTGGLLTDDERRALYEDEDTRRVADGWPPLPPYPSDEEMHRYDGRMFLCGITFFVGFGLYVYFASAARPIDTLYALLAGIALAILVAVVMMTKTVLRRRASPSVAGS